MWTVHNYELAAQALWALQPLPGLYLAQRAGEWTASISGATGDDVVLSDGVTLGAQQWRYHPLLAALGVYDVTLDAQHIWVDGTLVLSNDTPIEAFYSADLILHSTNDDKLRQAFDHYEAIVQYMRSIAVLEQRCHPRSVPMNDVIRRLIAFDHAIAPLSVTQRSELDFVLRQLTAYVSQAGRVRTAAVLTQRPDWDVLTNIVTVGQFTFDRKYIQRATQLYLEVELCYG